MKSQEDLTNLSNGTAHTAKKRENRASSFSPPHHPLPSAQASVVEASSSPAKPDVGVEPREERSRGEVQRLTEKFEASTPNSARAALAQSSSIPSQSLQSPPGTGRRNSTENSDSGRESMVLEPDNAVPVN